MMTDAEKVALVKLLSDESDDNTIYASLQLAGETIYKYVDPYKTGTMEEALADCGGTQAKAAAYYLNKRGWDFESGHSENGINRTYEAGDLPGSILRELVPKCGVTG